jgi:hypothetical protein
MPTEFDDLVHLLEPSKSKRLTLRNVRKLQKALEAEEQRVKVEEGTSATRNVAQWTDASQRWVQANMR